MISGRVEGEQRRLHHIAARRAALTLAVVLLLLPAGMGAEARSDARPDARSDERVARCRVESAGTVEFNGPCLFTAEKGGSFGLQNSARNGPLFGETLMVSVSIVSPGVAEVRGLTRAGVNSNWGEAHRSKRDGACWEGSDFRVCAH